MKRLKMFLMMILLVSFITSCGSDTTTGSSSNSDGEGSAFDDLAAKSTGADGNSSLSQEEEELQESISAKWTLDEDGEYESFEFNKSGSYIIVKNEIDEYTEQKVNQFGEYAVIDEETLELSGFGTLSIEEVDDESIDLSITLEDEPDSVITVSATKNEQMESTTRIDLLCRTWETTIELEEELYDEETDTYTDTTMIYEVSVLFSTAGTYFVEYLNLDEDADRHGGLAHWQWEDDSEEMLMYSWDAIPEFTDERIVDISYLSKDSLVIIEREKVYECTAVSYDDVALTKTIVTETLPSLKLESGFFKK